MMRWVWALALVVTIPVFGQDQLVGRDTGGNGGDGNEASYYLLGQTILESLQSWKSKNAGCPLSTSELDALENVLNQEIPFEERCPQEDYAGFFSIDVQSNGSVRYSVRPEGFDRSLQEGRTLSEMLEFLLMQAKISLEKSKVVQKHMDGELKELTIEFQKHSRRMELLAKAALDVGPEGGSAGFKLNAGDFQIMGLVFLAELIEQRRKQNFTGASLKVSELSALSRAILRTPVNFVRGPVVDRYGDQKDAVVRQTVANGIYIDVDDERFQISFRQGKGYRVVGHEYFRTAGILDDQWKASRPLILKTMDKLSGQMAFHIRQVRATGNFLKSQKSLAPIFHTAFASYLQRSGIAPLSGFIGQKPSLTPAFVQPLMLLADVGGLEMVESQVLARRLRTGSVMDRQMALAKLEKFIQTAGMGKLGLPVLASALWDADESIRASAVRAMERLNDGNRSLLASQFLTPERQKLFGQPGHGGDWIATPANAKSKLSVRGVFRPLPEGAVPTEILDSASRSSEMRMDTLAFIRGLDNSVSEIDNSTRLAVPAPTLLPEYARRFMSRDAFDPALEMNSSKYFSPFVSSSFFPLSASSAVHIQNTAYARDLAAYHFLSKFVPLEYLLPPFHELGAAEVSDRSRDTRRSTGPLNLAYWNALTGRIAWTDPLDFKNPMAHHQRQLFAHYILSRAGLTPVQMDRVGLPPFD